VAVRGSDLEIGDMVQVKITARRTHSLEGEVVPS